MKLNKTERAEIIGAFNRLLEHARIDRRITDEQGTLWVHSPKAHPYTGVCTGNLITALHLAGPSRP